MSVIVQITKDLAKLVDAPTMVPLETVDKRFSAIFNTFAKHGATYSLGFGATAHRINVNTSKIKNVDSLVEDLTDLNGVEGFSIMGPNGIPMRRPGGDTKPRGR